MYYYNHGHAGLEGHFFRLVTKEVHAKEGSYGAANSGEEPERAFTHAAIIELRFEFINAKIKKGDHVDEKKIDEEELLQERKREEPSGHIHKYYS